MLCGEASTWRSKPGDSGDSSKSSSAVWEISGHIVLKIRKDFDEASEQYALRLLAEVSLSEDRFQEVISYILEGAVLQEANLKENNSTNQEENSL